MSRTHGEHHRIDAIAWLRAAVLGANDGIVSTASLLLGVAAAHADAHTLWVTGVAGLVAGAMSMATGEYVSVHSQADSEKAALALEREELATNPGGEHRELTEIYRRRGVDHETAHTVAQQLMDHDALDAHARDELGIYEHTVARPLQAAVVSALSFATGAALPLLVSLFAAATLVVPAIWVSALVALAILGAVAARTGGANMWRGSLRVTLWSALAMAVTSGIGSLVGASL